MYEVIDDVCNRRAEIGVISITEVSEKMIRRLLDARDLEFHEITAVQPCIFVRKGHPLTQVSHLTDSDLEPYPYVLFELTQGVASDFSEEYPVPSTKRPDRCIHVNSRASVMRILSSTDAYTTGSGLLTDHAINQPIVTLPLDGKNSVHIGWISPRGSILSLLALQYLGLLTQAVEDSISFTNSLRQSSCES